MSLRLMIPTDAFVLGFSGIKTDFVSLNSGSFPYFGVGRQYCSRPRVTM